MTDIAIHELDRGDVLRAFPAIGRVYHAAFSVPEVAATQRFLDHSLSAHVSYPGFRMLVARRDDDLLGFCYGYRSEAGRWWHDTVASAIADAAGEHWLDDAFEFVEFAVLPEWQGMGIGGTLHDGLLGEVTESRALLSTDAGDNPARAFYARRGWVDLVQRFLYPGATVPATLMGLDLIAWRDRATTSEDVE